MKKNIYEGPAQGAYKDSCFIHMMQKELGFSFQKGTMLAEYQVWHACERTLITYNGGPHPAGTVEVVVEVDGPDDEFATVKKQIIDKAENIRNWWFKD